MALPATPVTLGVQQIQDLSQHFSFFRHDVNNSVGLISAAAELMRYNPAAAKKWGVTLIEQPPRIAGKTREFIEEVERVLGIRESNSSWYRDMWVRSNAPPCAPAAAAPLTPAQVESLHQELLNVHKELAHLGFAASGADAVAARKPDAASVGTAAVTDQLPKLMSRFAEFAALFEKTFGVQSLPHRLLTGVPAGSVALSPEEVGLFQRKLANLEQDIHEHLGPLLELSRLARGSPEQLQTRAPELAPSATKIAGAVQEFGVVFDKMFGLQRGQ